MGSSRDRVTYSWTFHWSCEGARDEVCNEEDEDGGQDGGKVEVHFESGRSFNRADGSEGEGCRCVLDGCVDGGLRLRDF